MTREVTGFLYPFLDAAVVENPEVLLTDLARSARAKWDDSVHLAATSVSANATALADAVEMFAQARQVLVAGNGGSACDAERMARLWRGIATPGDDGGCRVRSLVSDPATLTALANDLGVDQIFARQVVAYGRPGDVLVVLSTSGNSSNLLAACDTAIRLGLRTVGIAGYSGGAMADHAGVECCLRVESDSVHRIQEAQAALVDTLVAAVMARRVRVDSR